MPGALEAVEEGDSTAKLLDNAPGSCTAARLQGLLAGSTDGAADAAVNIVVGRYLEDTLLLWLLLRRCRVDEGVRWSRAAEQQSVGLMVSMRCASHH